MVRPLVAVAVLVLAGCSSSSSSPSGGDGSCPDVGGTWKVTQHCDASLVGTSAVVTQSGCALTFGAPFNGFTGTVTSDDRITVTGPQSCSGTVTSAAITMSCTPGACAVTLGH